jgi:uncharacterized protein
MHSTTNLKPIQHTERAQILDVLRGIAILGIFINNIYGFSGYGSFTEEFKEQLSTYPIDKVISFLQTMLVEGKFYSLFSLLFGIGFSIIIIRNEQKGMNAFKVFYRRIAILFLIGAAHIYFLWDGDILLLYAMLGFILPLFKKCSDKGLLIWAALLILSPLVIDVIKILLQVNPGDFLQPIAEGIDKKTGVPTDDGWRTYLFKDGSGWQEWRNYQSSSFIYRYQYLLNSNRIPKVLGMFLIGFYVGRKMMYANLSNYATLLKKLMLWGFIIGLPASFAMAWFAGDGKNVYQSVWGLLDTFFYAIGVVPLSLAYVSAICLYWVKTKGINKLSVFAPVGRMALTNYLLQTIFGVLIFYGVGLGVGQKIGPVYFIPIAIGFYLLQVIFSNIWLKYFQFGPFEWAWRSLTYGKKQPMKKTIEGKIIP